MAIAESPARLADRRPTLLFLCPLPSNWVGASRLRVAERAPLIFPTLLPEVEFGGNFAPDGSLPADIEGEGDEVEEWTPLV